MIADADHAARILRVKLARAEVERLGKDARLTALNGFKVRQNGTSPLMGQRALRDAAGDELHSALEAACE